MRIVHLLPALEQGGVESVVCDLTRLLAQAGEEVVVISRGGRLVERVESAGARHVALDLKSKNPLSVPGRVAKLRRVLRAIGPDLVCTHSRVPAWLFSFANRALRLPWVSYVHGANSVSRYSAVMTRGDRVIVPSRFLADFLRANYPARWTAGRAEDLVVIPNPIDLVRFDPAKLDAAFMDEKRRAWGIAEGDFVSMAIGRITPIKGFDALIRETPSDRKLVIVGGADVDRADYLASLKALAGPNVVFAGPQTKIPECIALASEIVIGNTTKPESFGLSALEAYAMNKPVRALRRFGGVAEIMDLVASAQAPTFRDAVVALFDSGLIIKQTRSVYRACQTASSDPPLAIHHRF